MHGRGGVGVCRFGVFVYGSAHDSAHGELVVGRIDFESVTQVGVTLGVDGQPHSAYAVLGLGDVVGGEDEVKGSGSFDGVGMIEVVAQGVAHGCGNGQVVGKSVGVQLCKELGGEVGGEHVGGFGGGDGAHGE